MSTPRTIQRLIDKYHASVEAYNKNRSSPYLYEQMKKAEQKLDEKLEAELKKAKP